MSSDEQLSSAQRKFELTRQFYKRACAEGRGDQALAKLRALKAAKNETYARTDEDIRQQIHNLGEEERAEVRRILEECVNKTDFDREEPAEIREMMMQDLAEQELTIELLRVEGVPESQLPQISVALARLNAYERKNGQFADDEWREWTDNDPRIRYNRIKAHEILSGKKLKEEQGVNLEVSYESAPDDTNSSMADIPARKPHKYTLN